MILTPATTPNEAIDLIKKMEGLRLRAYRDIGGVWTIGYGHTSAGGPPEVGPGLTISRERAEQILLADVARVASEIQPLYRAQGHQAPIRALLCFAYNVGAGTSGARRCSRRSMTGTSRRCRGGSPCGTRWADAPYPD